jgi:hypothetical protein
MANLTSFQIKDSYQSVLTTSETTSDPTTGTLQNGKGTAITTLTVSGTVNATTLGGTLSTASQPNVTSVGTLTSLAVTGGVTALFVGVNGVVFPATQVPATDPNTLDDYEEGTFDYGIAFGGASVGVTYAFRQGSYVKIGNKVTVTGQILLTSKGSSTGTATITGLPFSIPNNSNRFTGVAIGFINNITFADQMTAYGITNTASIQLAETTSAGVVSVLTDADFTDTSSVIISMTYIV